MRREARRGAGTGGLVVLVAALAACARVQPLGGGPPDVTPPALEAAVPADSSTGLPRQPQFELRFSKNVSAPSVKRGVRFYPPVRIGEVRVRGRHVRLTLADSLPPDTTIVLVLGKSIQDLPGRDNKLPEEVQLLYATGPRLRAAAVLGRVTLKGQADPRLAVAWEPAPAESLRAGRAPTYPVAAANAEGLFRLLGLPPERRFRLRAFVDQNGDLHPDDNELQAVYPETLQLRVGEVRRGLAWNIVDPNEPGELGGVVVNLTSVQGPLAIAVRRPPPAARDTSRPQPESLAVRGRADTLRPRNLPAPPRDRSPWAKAYAALEPRGFVKGEWLLVYASPRGDYSVRVPPGSHDILAFVDAARDSAPGLYVRPDSSALAWEPLWVGGKLEVKPGAKVRPRAIEVAE